ncbi:MAG: hypothetical protein CVV28_11655 [Methanobacteriales archaeon HGW-Methanobacteriales-1]|jgi:hypothetical protein|nr:MAG: hypothetical protein CVV28_11655 [Methanobacteriales archaeon HGW-Methanobacteriales-1]
MLYEMRIPPGVTERNMAEIITNYEVDLAHTDHGPVLKGEMEELEKVREYMVKSLNERIELFEEQKKPSQTK